MTLDDLNLDDATRVALAALSRRMKRTPEQIAAEAIREVVRDTSVAQADAGSTMTLDEWRAFKRRPTRRCR